MNPPSIDFDTAPPGSCYKLSSANAPEDPCFEFFLQLDEQDRAEKKLEKEIKKRLETETPIEVFEALSQGAPREVELQKLGETSEPVRAVYYATPPYEDDEDDD